MGTPVSSYPGARRIDREITRWRRRQAIWHLVRRLAPWAIALLLVLALMALEGIGNTAGLQPEQLIP
jgi:hypothetical protein